MMEIYLIVTAVIFLAGTPGYFGFSPQAQFEAGEISTPPPRCFRRASTAEKPEGKRATYSQTDESYCPKNIFSYEDRPSIYSYMADNLPVLARKAALKLKTYELEGRLPRDVLWSIEIDFDDRYIKRFAHKLFLTEITQIAPKLQLSHSPADDTDNFRIEVKINRVDEPFALADVNVVQRLASGPKRWQIK